MANVLKPRPSNRSSATISLTTAADGASESINLTGLVLTGVSMPASWTDAKLGFQNSVDGSTFQSVYNTAGDHLTYATSANRTVIFDPAVTVGLQLIKIISESSAGVATAQAATRTLKLILSEG